MSREKPLLSSFIYAFSGIKTAIKNEPNIRIHLLIAIVAISLALLLGFSLNEWVILLFTIAFVLVLELVNTSLEALINVVSPEVREEARVAKDVSAAAVLISALLSIIVGAFLFLPKILQFWVPK